MKRLPLLNMVVVSTIAVVAAFNAAQSGEKQTPFLSAYLRSELAFSHEHFGGVYALSQNGVAVGSIELDVPARWVNGELDWSAEKLNGAATCVSDDGAWLAGSTLDGTVVFRKHGDEPLDELPLLEAENGARVSGSATGIRADGATVGVCRIVVGDNVIEHAVRWSPEGQIERLLPNTALSRAEAINEAGDIVGSYQTTIAAPRRAFLLTGGQLLDPTHGAEGVCTATAISPAGLVAGALVQPGSGPSWYLLRGDVVTVVPLDQVNGAGEPSEINDSGLIAGSQVVWLNGQFYRLNDLLPRSDKATVTATDLNNAGQIAANGHERIGGISERYTANVLYPLEAGPDLQGTIENLRVRSVGRSGRRVFRIQGTLRVVNGGTARAGASVAELTLPPAPTTERRRTGARPIRIPALEPGEDRRVRIDGAIPGSRGAVQVQILLDARHRVAETNETNNLIQVAPQ